MATVLTATCSSLYVQNNFPILESIFSTIIAYILTMRWPWITKNRTFFEMPCGNNATFGISLVRWRCEHRNRSWSLKDQWLVVSCGDDYERRWTDRIHAVYVPNDLTTQQQVQWNLNMCQRSPFLLVISVHENPK